MDTIVVVEGEKLTYTPDSGSDTVVLSKWVCDKHYDKVIIKNAYGEPIVLDKISATNPISVNSTEYTDPAEAREAIGTNW